jgi:hypothetical protein
MKNKIPIALILLFGMIVMSSGCHTPTSSGLPAVKKIPSLSDTGLSGTSWKWLYSIGGFSGGEIKSPGTRGYNLKLQFSNDSLFSFLRNDTLIETAQYSISNDSVDYPFYSYHISFQNILITQYAINVLGDGYQSDALIALQGDTLILEKKDVGDGYVDRFILIQ